MHHEGTLFSQTWHVRTSRLSYLRAVVIVFERLDDEGREPRASRFNNPAYLQKHAMPHVLAEWSKRTGLDESLFPWSLFEVCSTWEEWRKMNSDQGGRHCDDLGLAELGVKYRSKAEAKRERAST